MDFAGIGGRRDVDAERAVLDGHSALVDLDRVFDAAFRHVIAFVKALGFLDLVDRNWMIVDVHDADVNRRGRVTRFAGIDGKRSQFARQNARLLQTGTEAFDLVNGNEWRHSIVISDFPLHKSDYEQTGCSSDLSIHSLKRAITQEKRLGGPLLLDHYIQNDGRSRSRSAIKREKGFFSRYGEIATGEKNR